MADEWSYESTLIWDLGGASLVDALPVLLTSGAATFAQADSGLTTAGTNLRALIERIGLPLATKAQRPSLEYLVTGIWPHISGTPGDVINVYLGTQLTAPTDAPVYTGPFPFVIGTTEFIDTIISGRYACVKFESDLPRVWQLLGYEIEYAVVGNH